MNILLSNYTNRHITYNKGEYIGCLDPTIEEIPQTTENPDAPTIHSITTEKMIEERVELDTFKPPHHKLKQHYRNKAQRIIKGIQISVFTR